MKPYLSVQGIQDHQIVHFFQAHQPVLSLQDTLGIQDDLVVQGNPSVLENRFHLRKEIDNQNIIVFILLQC